jgi:hypothetical protein
MKIGMQINNMHKHLARIARMNVAAGVKLLMAVTNVAEVNFMASTYRLWFIVNLHVYI